MGDKIIKTYKKDGFILTMRNVNIKTMKQLRELWEGFILTMRNVNSKSSDKKDTVTFCFILTMRNVNEERREIDRN